LSMPAATHLKCHKGCCPPTLPPATPRATLPCPPRSWAQKPP